MTALSEADIAELDKDMRLFEELISQRKLDSYNPYWWQKEFHDAGRENEERMLMAANRCIVPHTIIGTVPQARPLADILGEERFYVRSWADGSECVAQASGVFLKGIEQAFHVQMDNGQWFQCSRKHRVLTCDGWLSLGQLVQRASGLRWTRKVRDWMGSCGAGDYLDGGQLQSASGSATISLPSGGDAQTLDPLIFSRTGAAARISQCSRVYPELVRRSNPDDPALLADLFARFPDPAPYIDALQQSDAHREFRQFQSELIHQQRVRAGGLHQPSEADACHLANEALAGSNTPEPSPSGRQDDLQSPEPFDLQKALRRSVDGELLVSTFYPCDHPKLVGAEGNIAFVVPIGFHPIADFTVSQTACYEAGGVIHHNTGKTMSAGAETAYHLTGDYPDWWDGHRFKEPIWWWCGSPTSETSRDIVQKLLLGGLGEKLGTGWIPKNKLVGSPVTRQAGVKGVVESFGVRHISGGVSECSLKAYEQGWEKWQGRSINGAWLDEEPDDYMIYSEAQTRVLDLKGIIMVTFTPLSGVTDLVEHFQTGGKGIWVIGASWDDAPHLGEEEKERLSASYRAHERDARTKGIPMMGEGAVFPVPDEDLLVDPFRIPPHWARLKGLDFGIGHPAAGAEIAWDRDEDVIYVVDCYRKAGETAAYHAEWFKKANSQIPVAWPHDGMNREKSGGVQLKQSYADRGVKLLAKSARYPKRMGEDKEKGGNQPVEPIIDEIFDRMLTGRFKVFANCREWFEEKRSYHRKDGKIVDLRDDILKATFYAVMMKRYAVPMSTFSRGPRKSNARPVASVRV